MWQHDWFIFQRSESAAETLPPFTLTAATLEAGSEE
jgi:hypothetical protein